MTAKSPLLCLTLAAVLFSASAHGEEAPTGMVEMTTWALDPLEKEDFSTALERLQQVMERYPSPLAARWAGFCLQRLGRLVEAAAMYRQALSLTPPPDDEVTHEQAQEKAKALLAKVEARIPHLTLQVEGVSAEVEAEGEEIDVGAPRDDLEVVRRKDLHEQEVSHLEAQGEEERQRRDSENDAHRCRRKVPQMAPEIGGHRPQSPAANHSPSPF